MERKKTLLVIGITMSPAGTEKSFLSFASCLDYEKWDVTLLLAEKGGLFLPMLPKEIKVIEMPEYGEMFTLNGGNAASVILKTMVKKRPGVLFEMLPYVVKMVLSPKKRSDYAMEMWCRLAKHFPDVQGEYDVAAAYWGDKTMFYMIDHVKADKKLAWLHFDYMNPPRSDSLYLPAFRACDRVVTVSSRIHSSMQAHFPELKEKLVMMENIQDPRLIWDLALRGDTFPDTHFTGKRILTVGRIAEQKGYDMAVDALARLRDDGYNVRWYIIGGGDAADVEALKLRAVEKNVADMLILLGTTPNPYTYMRDCDIYAQPSRHEGKPIAVEEAKLLYKTILVCNYLSAHEQLEDGALGAICEISPDGVYEGMKRLLDDPALCARYSDRLTERKFGNAEEIEVFYRMVQDEKQ